MVLVPTDRVLTHQHKRSRHKNDEEHPGHGYAWGSREERLRLQSQRLVLEHADRETKHTGDIHHTDDNDNGHATDADVADAHHEPGHRRPGQHWSGQLGHREPNHPAELDIAPPGWPRPARPSGAIAGELAADSQPALMTSVADLAASAMGHTSGARFPGRGRETADLGTWQESDDPTEVDLPAIAAGWTMYGSGESGTYYVHDDGRNQIERPAFCAAELVAQPQRAQKRCAPWASEPRQAEPTETADAPTCGGTSFGPPPGLEGILAFFSFFFLGGGFLGHFCRMPQISAAAHTS